MSNFNTVVEIVSHVPVFVWFILGYLIYVGVQALKPRLVSIYRLILLPVVLILLKYKYFTSPDVWVYAAGILAGIGIGFLKVRTAEIEIRKDSKTILIPGSSSLIVILLSFFVLKYYFGYLQAMSPSTYAKQLVWDLSISGLLSGYFTGQRISFLNRYFKHP